MGEVYRANDPRLRREVAIKVLPSEYLSEGRRQRFQREVRAVARLSHPHIVTVHEVESADGIDFIVMEYVRGKSLDALIPRHGLRLDETLRIAIAITDALTVAHAHGIVHRDLKPSNVMVGRDGAVKVLDFGLAKIIDTETAPEDETVTVVGRQDLNAPGMIASTAAYMSPEQASGQPLDARSDIFSFGAVLYEMATGVRAFQGSSVQDTLDAVKRAQPVADTMTSHLPTDLKKLIARCLRKEPERRFHHMVDVKVALQDIKEESESGTIVVRGPAERSRRDRRVVALTIAVALLTAAIVGGWLWLRAHPGPPLLPMHLLAFTTLTDVPGLALGDAPELHRKSTCDTKLALLR
jgi:serine/threonine protein kinase